MDRSIYKRLYKLGSGYSPFLVLSSLSAFIYVAFNGLSVWLPATLFNNILTDFDELIMNQNILASSKPIPLLDPVIRHFFVFIQKIKSINK